MRACGDENNNTRWPNEPQVALEVQPDTVRLEIADDGVGLPPRALECAGLGLKIMHHRADMIGARLSVGPAENGGTLLLCECRQPE